MEQQLHRVTHAKEKTKQKQSYIISDKNYWKNCNVIGSVNYGKNCYLDNFVVLSPLNNVEEQWVKLVSSNVIGSQHCIGEKGEF